MKISSFYHEPHNYKNKPPSIAVQKLKNYAVAFLLTAFWVYSFVGAVHWGQHHCLKSKAIKKQK